jgi:hypothetical protein
MYSKLDKIVSVHPARHCQDGMYASGFVESCTLVLPAAPSHALFVKLQTVRAQRKSQILLPQVSSP